MKIFLVIGISLAALTSAAETYLFEPYVDAQYSCNWIEGLNYRIPVEAQSAEEALALVKPQVGQSLVVGCNRDIYQCVHKDGDVEPRPISFSHEERSLMLIGGRILNSEGTQELLQIGQVHYHRNLRPLPKCKW
ncbi:MAG: hypothetical protein K0R29_1343 [Pseudobdellovibrio sp.]|jgi:hypothetical protein|nr:hypothetical protein [Pseudobdellovibrio sp.]